MKRNISGFAPTMASQIGCGSPCLTQQPKATRESGWGSAAGELIAETTTTAMNKACQRLLILFIRWMQGETDCGLATRPEDATERRHLAIGRSTAQTHPSYRDSLDPNRVLWTK